jgi:hypothetical protein
MSVIYNVEIVHNLQVIVLIVLIQKFLAILNALNPAQKRLIRKALNVLNVILIAKIVLRAKVSVLPAPLC